MLTCEGVEEVAGEEARAVAEAQQRAGLTHLTDQDLAEAVAATACRG